MQISEKDTIRLVCYAPKQRVNINQAYQTKSPVKILGTKRKISNRYDSTSISEEYNILKTAKITPTTVNFKYDESLSRNLYTVNECLQAPVYSTIDLKVKIMTKNDNKQAIIHNEQTKYKCDCIVADATDSIKFVLWEDTIDKVQAGNSYHLQNIKVRIFDDIKFVNSNECTKITQIEDIEDHEVNLTSPELQENIITAQCIGIDIKKTNACIACNNSLQDTDTDTITCPKCNITTLTELAKTKMLCQMVLRCKGNITSYTCFNDGLDSFLKHQKCTISLSTIELTELKKMILQAGEQNIIVDKAQKVIHQFLPPTCTIDD